MFAVGLTGGIGSGKSTVADLFAAHGVPLIDTDLIAHQHHRAATASPCRRSRREFGAEFVAADGSLDRARMRALVFSDDGARKARSKRITHPLIRAETEREQREAQGLIVIVVVPLLVESGNVEDARESRAGGRLQRRNADRARDEPQRLQPRTGAGDHRPSGDARSAPRRGRRRDRQRRHAPLDALTSASRRAACACICRSPGA